MFHRFLCFLSRSLFSLSLIFTLWSAGTAKFTIWYILFSLLFVIIRSGILIRIMWSVWISKSQRILCVSLSMTYSGLSFVCLVKLKFLAQFPVDHLLHPILSSLKLLLRKFNTFTCYTINLFVWIHFCPILSIFALIQVVLKRCFVLLFSQDFPFVAMFKSFHVQSCQFITWNIHRIVFLPISASKFLLVFYPYLCCHCSNWLL